MLFRLAAQLEQARRGSRGSRRRRDDLGAPDPLLSRRRTHMLTSRTLAWVALVLIPGMLASGAAAQQPYLDKEGKWHDLPPTYTLACRGPLSVEIGLNFSPPVKLEFRKGRKPATSGVDPGTCAWMDRSISDREASCLQHHTSDAWVRVSPPAPQASPVATRLRDTTVIDQRVTGAAKSGPPPAATPPPSPPAPTGPPTVRLGSTFGGASYLDHIATSSEKVAYFRAFSMQGRACFMVERLGP
jgi:hypothetical protein